MTEYARWNLVALADELEAAARERHPSGDDCEAAEYTRSVVTAYRYAAVDPETSPDTLTKLIEHAKADIAAYRSAAPLAAREQTRRALTRTQRLWITSALGTLFVLTTGALISILATGTASWNNAIAGSIAIATGVGAAALLKTGIEYAREWVNGANR